MKIVVDAFAWLEIFIGSDKGKRVKEILKKALQIYTPQTVLAEIARKYLRERVEKNLILERLGTITQASEITHIDEKTALLSAEAYLEMQRKAKSDGLSTPSLFDAIILATARSLDAKVLTGDKHFADLPETIWIG